MTPQIRMAIDYFQNVDAVGSSDTVLILNMLLIPIPFSFKHSI